MIVESITLVLVFVMLCVLVYLAYRLLRASHDFAELASFVQQYFIDASANVDKQQQEQQ